MKKVTIGILLLTSSFAFAQQVELPKSGAEIRPNRKLVASQSPARLHKPTSVSNEHFIWGYAENMAQYQIAIPGVPVANFGFYLNPIFMDSTTYASAGGTLTEVSDMRAGVMFDPTSPIYDTTNWSQSAVTPSMSYTIDTIFVAGKYEIVKNNAHPDTLEVDVTWGAKVLSPVQGPWEYIYTIASPAQSWNVPECIPSKLNGNVSHLSMGKGGFTKKTIKRVLTAADTVTMSGKYPGFIVVLVNQLIPAGDIVSASCVFVPGVTYTAGAVDFTYAGTSIPATQNGFGVNLYGDATTAGNNNYFYDSINNAKARSFNSGLFYSQTSRYSNQPAAYALFDSILDPDPNYTWQIDFAISCVATGINENVANELKVNQNIPNPFTDATVISYELAENVAVSLDIYDITGQKIQTIEQGRQSTGAHAIQLNSANLQAGMYFYTLTAGTNRITKRMIVVK
jgi:hypothetical protein